MIREFVRLNFDIFNYATRQVADYWTLGNYEAKTVVSEFKYEIIIRRLFNGFLTDLQNSLKRLVISETEVNAVSELFKTEYLKFLRENHRIISSCRITSSDDLFPKYLNSTVSSSLREQKVVEHYNDLKSDLTDHRVIYFSTSVTTSSNLKNALIDETNISNRIDSFVDTIKELYGLNAPNVSVIIQDSTETI